MFIRVGEIAGHAAAIYDIQYDGKYIYSASGDKFIARWDNETLEQDKFAIRFPFTPYSLSLSKNNQHLAVGLSDGAMHIFDLNQRQEIKHLQIHQKGIFTLEYLPELNWLLAADGEGLVTLWKSSNYELVVRLPLDCGKVRAAQYHPETDSILIGAQDGKIYSLSCVTLNVSILTHAHEGGVGCILSLENQNTFITGGKDGHLRIWDHQWNCLVEIPAHNYMIYDLMQLDEYTIVSASRDKSMKIWDVTTMKVKQKLDLKHKGHRHSVNKLLQLDKHLFASCSDDARVLIWSQTAL